MEWNFRSGIPIYTQIIDEMTVRIASGSYLPGDKLPSVRELAVDAGVNPNTMQRALAELERRGLVFAERTAGRFVTRDEKIISELKEDLAKRYFCEYTEKLRRIGMSEKDIAEETEKWLRRKNTDGND